ncbi:MAG: YceI family protein [Bacteroidetes bacterium]|nr:YceI family protein [Bacteroidota bacterium]
MKYLLMGLIAVIMYCNAAAQRFYTKNGSISFYSKTALEDIKADNNQVMALVNTQTGELRFSLLTKGFHFKKALMEEHFNQDYMESSQYPNATFKGSITDLTKVRFDKDGSYNVPVSGELTIHGVTRKVTTTGVITVKDGKIAGSAKFMVTVADYKISIPKVYTDNIAKTVEVTVTCSFDQKL